MGINQKILLTFWRANCAYPWLFFTTIATFIIGMTLQKIGMPLIVAAAINTLVVVRELEWGLFTPFIITLVIFAVVAQVLNDISLWLLSRLETKVRPALQMRIFNHLMSQSLNFHGNNFSGALVNQTSKFTSAYVTITDTLSINLMIIVVISVFSIAVTAFYLPVVALGMAIWTAFFVWLNIKLTRGRIVLSRAAATADSALTAHLADTIGNVAAVKAFGHEAQEAAAHEQKSQDRAYKKYLAWVRAVKNDFVFGMLMGTLQIGVLALSIQAVMNGAVEIGTLLLVQVYVTQLIGQLWSLSGLSRNVEQALSDAAEMTETLSGDIEIKDPSNPKKLMIKKGEIAFNNVTFAHDGNNDALFTNFSLHVPAGKKVGLVGHSGSGKTSLTRLLLRFVDIDSGQITIDGQDIRQVTQNDLRTHIAYVPQEPLLFHRSLRDNIAYGKPGASDEEIYNAAHLAHAAEFIESLPKGYQTMVGERGVKLSGGQRQRIAIARAILKDAPILVLDEATSALDSESERLIQDALKKLMQGRTTIVIAHRLSTIQKMDRIVVLQDGKVIEQGSHMQLLAKNGTYAELWQHQSGGFLDD